MEKKYKFKSDLLNEELNKHNLSFCKNIRVKKIHEMLNNIEGNSVMVRVFPHEEIKNEIDFNDVKNHWLSFIDVNSGCIWNDNSVIDFKEI